MKLILTTLFLLAAAFSCTQKGTPATTGQTTITPAEVSPGKKLETATEVELTKESMKGAWQAAKDENYVIEFFDEPGKEMQFVIYYENNPIDQGIWEIPADCTLCKKPDAHACFLMKTEEGTSCFVVPLITAGIIQYHLADNLRKMQAYKRIR
jgi:hypothetical protein